MEILSVVFSAIAALISVIVLVLVLKKNEDKGLTNRDLNAVKDTVNESIKVLGDTVTELIAEKNKKTIDELNQMVIDLNKKMNDLIENNKETSKSLTEFNEKLLKAENAQKEEIMKKLSDEIASFNEKVTKTLSEFNSSIKEKLDDFKKDTKESISGLSETVSKNLKEIREDNNQKLDSINKSVNEQLQKTLEEKLKDSFKSVVEGIGDVNKAVGEIKGLATDVGSLKNVLTNVKTKGIMGEVILGNIIKEFLTAGQYEENVITKKGSTERVEFAIKLPGTKDDTILLPVDSKFPYEAYSVIQESSNIDEINEAKKLLRSNLLKYAKDVNEKYLDVPNTTDFAVIFLPLEGLYLEALNMGLFEEIQSKYKVNLTGPTTFTAFINSLNMGFRSLMIQKKSADVFKLLGAVKTEFGKFADALEKTQNKVNAAADELDKLVGTRTKMMNSKLKGIDALDDETAKLILEENKEEE